MKILFDSPDALLTELRDRTVTVVRISPAIERETGARTGGILHLTSRVIVSAAIDTHLWVEWRYWVGRAVAEISERGLHLPGTLRRKGDEAIAAIAKHVDDAGFQILEGILAHDTAIACYLVWWLTQSLGARVDRMIQLLEQIALAVKVDAP